MPKQRTREEAAAYMREYRKRQRTGAGSAAAAPFDFQDVELAAIAEPPAGDPDSVTLTVRIDDAQFAKLAALMRAVEARHGSTVRLDDAMRLAVEVAHRAIAGAD